MNSESPNPPASVTVIVRTRNRPRELEGCLQALANLNYPHETLVVDNASSDTSARELAQRYHVRYLHSPVPGLSRARNDGARNCATELLAYTDDDARPLPDWLSNLVCEFSDPAVMAVGGEMLQPGVLVSSADINPRGASVSIGPDSRDWFSLTNFGGVGDGCNVCFRRTAFELFPGFDERLGRGAILNSAEEHLAFFQLVLLGYKCVHTPRALVHHPSPATPCEIALFHRNNLVNAVTYAALLWAEFPGVRGQLLRHLCRRTFGLRTQARASSRAPRLSPLDHIRIIIQGLRLFWKLPRSQRRTPLIAASQPTTAA